MTFESLMDTPRIFTALAEWGASVLYLLMLHRKMSGRKFILSLTASLFVFAAYQMFAGILPLYLWMPGMAGALLLMYLFLYLTTDSTRKDAAFCCTRAFVLAEFAASLHWQLYVWWVVTSGHSSRLVSIASMIFIYGVVFTAYFLLEKEHIPTEERMNVNGKELSGAALIALGSFAISNLSFIPFMHVKDICSIFGNALDNAIECVSQNEDPEKRLVTLSMYQKNRFLMIQCENYTETSVILKKNGLPATTKKDSINHGYGLKSIQHAAAKYGGSMTLHADGNWFTLQVLIPVNN